MKLDKYKGEGGLLTGLLFLSAIITGAILVVALSPMILLGIVIGILWNGSFVFSYEKRWPRALALIFFTLVTYVYLVGSPVPFEKIYGGVLFDQYGEGTAQAVKSGLSIANEILPKKIAFQKAQEDLLRIYLWIGMFIGVATFITLIRSGGDRGKRAFETYLNVTSKFESFFFVKWRYVARTLLISLLAYSNVIPCWCANLSFLFSLSVWVVNKLSQRPRLKAEAALRPLTEKPKAVGILLGHLRGRPGSGVYLSEGQLAHHVHIVGASGFGKSVLLSHLIEHRIRSRQGMLFVDLKADIETIKSVLEIAHMYGRSSDLQIFSCGNPGISKPYNVVLEGSANQIRDRIMMSLNWSEEFYKQEAASVLLKLLMFLTYLRETLQRPYTLSHILGAILYPDDLKSLTRLLPSSETGLFDQTMDLANYLLVPENQKALQGLKSQLESLVLSDFGNLLSSEEKGINLFEAIREKKLVFVLLDSRRYGESAHSMGKLILSDLKAASAKIDNAVMRNHREPFTVIVDEFADMATEEFVGFLDRARSSKIGVVIAHQEIADLDRISKEFTKRLMNSSSTTIAFLQKLPDSAELLSSLGGTQRVREVTEQMEYDVLLGDKKTGMKSMKIVDEYLIHPNVIRSLEVGECVLINKYPEARARIVRVRNESERSKDSLEIGNKFEAELRTIQSQLKNVKPKYNFVRRPDVPKEPDVDINEAVVPEQMELLADEKRQFGKDAIYRAQSKRQRMREKKLDQAKEK